MRQIRRTSFFNLWKSFLDRLLGTVHEQAKLDYDETTGTNGSREISLDLIFNVEFSVRGRAVGVGGEGGGVGRGNGKSYIGVPARARLITLKRSMQRRSYIIQAKLLYLSFG